MFLEISFALFLQPSVRVETFESLLGMDKTRLWTLLRFDDFLFRLLLWQFSWRSQELSAEAAQAGRRCLLELQRFQDRGDPGGYRGISQTSIAVSGLILSGTAFLSDWRTPCFLLVLLGKVNSVFSVILFSQNSAN